MNDQRALRASFAGQNQFNWRNLRLIILISMGACTFGYGVSIIGTTLGEPGFLLYMGLVDSATGEPTTNSAGLTGAITGTFYAGSFCGLLVGSWVMDKYGRKAGVIYAAILGLIGTIGVTAAQNVAMFVVFRFFCGAGANSFLGVTGVFTSELAPPALRGFFVGMVGGGIVIGYSIASLMGLACFYIDDLQAQWRVPLGLTLVFLVFMLCILPWLPESPRWLLMVGRDAEAKKLIYDIHKSSKDHSQTFAEQEFFQMQQQIELDKTMKTSWLEMFRKPSYRKRSIIALTFGFFNQSTGILVVGSYGTLIYKSLGYNARDVLCFQVGWILTAVPFNFLGAWLSDRWGRKPMFIIGLAGCAISLSLEAAIVATYVTPEQLLHPNQAALGMAVASLYLMMAFFGATLDVAGTPFINELFPNHLRSKGYSMTLAIMTCTTLTYTEVGPTALQHVGWRYYLLFICSSVVGCFWIYFTFPETKGIPLEEVAALFGDADEVVVYSASLSQDEKGQTVLVEGEKETTEVHVEIAK
ncbi:uncharacterized protein Z520_01245 [Fonsecaea multimorphosa CBS 102226]|uniref:Major facilitator superfamily (MFS) profile domain-containing protein n=1 Tax=Fonsecaea multimorphosa CBS 102226 TaxID=1442371 RepID=A0A0D2KH27_9EURO|nr:uncharacterized protein Z520_01245 [Fonsecaea multimorphosa CBS 102226]KIY02780.1 hypothetical protein Z520_01245 [Fonsecaea multimorphosa CBS 102226]OAL31204.1 hypothetical protein AYO22_01237 [Fonsecaea multimorphosa]